MRIQGTVGKVVLPRGFCFVDGDDGETYFLQADELEGNWDGERVKRGARAEFEPRMSKTGLRAAAARIA